MFRQPAFLLALGGAAALLVSSCGGGEATATPPAATATPKPAPTATPALAATQPASTTATPVPPTPTPRPAATATPVPATATPSGPAPKRGGTLKGTLLNDPVNFDSYDARGQLIASLSFMSVFSNIIVFDAEKPSKIMPDLAEKWTLSPDGKTVTFNIRQGVKWQNGKDLTAQDIAWNIQRGAKGEGTLTFNKSRFAAVDTVETLDNYTVKVNLKQPSASFLPNMAVVFVLIYPPFGPAPNTIEFRDPKVAIGSGPFKLQGYSPNTRVDYVRNDAYYKKDDAGRALPYLDAVTMFIIPNATNGLAAWRSKQVDCGCMWDHTYITGKEDLLMKEFPDAKLIGRNTASFHLQFNQKAPWTDQRIRKAVYIALDRLKVRDLYRGGKSFYPPTTMLSPDLGGGFGLPTKEVLAYPGFRVKDGKKDPADLDQAKQLFKEAGVDPKNLKIVFNHTTSTQDTGEVIQAALADIGVNVELRLLGTTGEQTDRLTRGDFDIALLQGGNGFDDPSDQPTRYLLSTSPENYGKWQRPAIDALYARMDREFDPAKRQALAYDFQRAVLEEAVATPLNYNYAVNGPHRWVFGLARGNYSTHSGQRLETVWIEESLR